MTTLGAQSLVQLPPAQLFRRFGSPLAGSWLFDARCDEVRVGAPVSLRLPVNRGGGRHGIDLLGRISAIRLDSMITIEHTQPWRGRLALRFTPEGPGQTRVRLTVDVPEEGIAWLVRRSGAGLPHLDGPSGSPAGGTGVRIGLITTKSGPAALHAMAAENLAQLAVEEVNAAGGVAGHELELLVADDASDPAVAATEARRLVSQGCRALFVVTTSVSFAAISKAVGSQVLLVHAVTNERPLGDSANVVRLGESAVAQLDALARTVVQTSGVRAWFLVGFGYSWSFRAHFAARRAVSRNGGRVVGESYTPLGTTDFSEVIERVRASGADVVLSTLHGADEVAFQRQSLAAGLRAQASNVSLVLDESTLDHMGPAAAEGIWTAAAYLRVSSASGNDELVRTYENAYGPWAPMVSSLTETVYEAILRYARALHGRGVELAPAQQAQLLRAESARGMGDAIGRRNLVRPGLYVAQARGGRWRIVDRTD